MYLVHICLCKWMVVWDVKLPKLGASGNACATPYVTRLAGLDLPPQISPLTVSVNSRAKVQSLERHKRVALVVEEGDSNLLERIRGGDTRFPDHLLRNLFVSWVCVSQTTTQHTSRGNVIYASAQ